MKRTLQGGKTRRTTIPITVWCLPEEREFLELYAQQSGLSMSSFLRRAALGYEIKSVVDFAAVHDMLRVAADMNRLGNLLKLWLTDRSRPNPPEVRILPKQIETCCQRLVDVAGQIVRG